MKAIPFILGFYAIMVPALSHSQRLDLFTSETGKLLNRGIYEKVPYGNPTGFFDCLLPEKAPDTVENGNSCNFIYFEVPHEVSEIGIRMISPVPPYAHAEAGDVVTPDYESCIQKGQYFDPWVALEQWLPEKNDTLGYRKASWHALGLNDDSDEVPAQPTGKHTNAVLRVHNGPYPSGIYRLKFKAGKKGAAAGCYLVHFGTIPSIKRMKISRTPFME